MEEALVGLRADFERNLLALDTARIANDSLQDAAQRLLGFTGPQGLGEGNPAVIDTLVARHPQSVHLRGLRRTPSIPSKHRQMGSPPK